MRFDFRKMRSTTMVLFVFICMATFYVTMAENNQCMCKCCKGSDCKDDMDMFTIDGCTTQLCIEQCQENYPQYCTGDGVTVDGECMGSMGKSSHIFNQYTTLGALILAFIAMAIFRI
jgi:hypothetical protein